MAFIDHVKNKIQQHDLKQLKRECFWLFGRIRQYKTKILMVGSLGMIGTVMGLASSVASKYLIDAVTGYNSTMLKQATVIMVLMMLGSLILQGLSSRVSASVHVHVKNEMQLCF